MVSIGGDQSSRPWKREGQERLVAGRGIAASIPPSVLFHTAERGRSKEALGGMRLSHPLELLRDEGARDDAQREGGR